MAVTSRYGSFGPLSDLSPRSAHPRRYPLAKRRNEPPLNPLNKEDTRSSERTPGSSSSKSESLLDHEVKAPSEEELIVRIPAESVKAKSH
jgi:hypothetical protein